jgi:hypothetical protein
MRSYADEYTKFYAYNAKDIDQNEADGTSSWTWWSA